MADYCAYPHCKCIVSTSTSQPDPVCPLDLQPVPDGPPSKCDGQCRASGKNWDENGFCRFCGEDGNA